MRHLNHQVNKNKQRKAEYFAGNWGSEWVNAGDPGHINSPSGLRNWPFGISQLQKRIQLKIMLIQHKQIKGKGMFFVEQDGNILAEMAYTMPSPDKMIIEHTEVSDELKGKKAGYQLVHTAVEYARTNNIRIIPLCPFANSVFKKKPEYADVLL